MGYVMHQLGGTVRILLDDQPCALQAIRELRSNIKHLAFVHPEKVYAAEDLHHALAAWRWSVADEDEAGNISALEFTGEKWGNDEALFSALAPYVSAGGEVRMVGEDGEVWRWIFNRATVKRQYGRVMFSPEYGPLNEFHTVLAQRSGS